MKNLFSKTTYKDITILCFDSKIDGITYYYVMLYKNYNTDRIHLQGKEYTSRSEALEVYKNLIMNIEYFTNFYIK